MKLLILGGGPLSVQFCRLAKDMGLETVVMDLNDRCPGAAAADTFISGDPARAELPAADYILSASDEDAVVARLGADNRLFDAAAWKIASSRFASDEFMQAHGITIPAYFPEGSEPYLSKPDHGSFGVGISVTDDYCEVGGAVNSGYVSQEELHGDVWSTAVLRRNGAAKVYPPAKLTRDILYKRLNAVCEEAPEGDQLTDTVRKIADALDLNGILEVEAILHNGKWTVVDLNARIPMLTPDAILAAGAGNMLADLIAQ